VKLQKQTIIHDPKNGKYGDCQRAAIASFLDMTVESVPHFLDGDPGIDIFNARLREFLGPKGLNLFAIPFDCDIENVLRTVGGINPGVPYMLVGESPRSVNHVVVCQDDAMIHDPHPSNAGLIGPCKEDGFYWVEVLSFSGAQ
jgi:hypothetical protein